MAVIKGTSNTDEALGGVHSGHGIADSMSVAGNAAHLSDAGISFASGDTPSAERGLIGALSSVGNTVKAANLLKNDPTALTTPESVEEMNAAKYGKATVGADGVSKKTSTALTPSTAFRNTPPHGKINTVKQSLKDAANESTPKSTQPAKPPKQGCADKDEPVDAIHGLVYYDLTDFEYPGVIPFSWTRSWNSGNAWLGALGYGTGSLYSMYIKREKTLVFVNEKGRKIYFDLLEAGETTVRRDEQQSLTYGVDKYEIFNHETRLRYVFEGKEGAAVHQLSRIETETGEHAIVLDYDGESRLSGMTDTAGRHFEITANATGQITKVKHDGRTLVEYAYDGKLNLTGVTDVNGAKSTIYYKNHLMIKRVTRNGDTFQWEYDGEDENARCVHTWGDNGLLEGWFEYNEDYTAYTNSLRSKERLYFI